MLKATSSAVTTAPLVFGGEPPLFGMLSLPRAGARTRGVVICAPFGHENTRSYRPLRTLAERIAAEGWPVLRFDWPGEGDSGDAASDSIEGAAAWTRPVRQAVRELRVHTGVEEVALVGLRIGATVGLLTALEEPAVSELALLAPYVTGESYLHDLSAFEVATWHLHSEPDEAVTSLPEGALEASGFLLSPPEVQTLESLDLAATNASRLSVRRALVVAVEDDASTRTLVQQLTGGVSDLSHRIRPDLARAWDGTNFSVLPHPCARLVCGWLREGRSPRSIREPARVARRIRTTLEGPGVEEEAVVLDTARGRRFGITCEPDERAGSDDAWVVFLSAARVRRSGPNRLWTTYARAWARECLPSLRLDVWGAGDSEGNRVLDELPVHIRSQYFAPGIGHDIAAALAWLTEHRGARRFALVGMSSGAYWAFQTALAERRVAATALVNLPTLHWDGRPTMQHPRQTLSDIRQFVATPRLWPHAVRPGARPPVRELVDEALELLGRSRARSYKPNLLEAFERLGSRGTETLLVFTEGDRGVGYVERNLARDFASLLERHRTTTEIVRGPDHTFRPLWSHDLLRRLLEAHLERTGFLGRASRPLVTAGAARGLD